MRRRERKTKAGEWISVFICQIYFRKSTKREKSCSREKIYFSCLIAQIERNRISVWMIIIFCIICRVWKIIMELVVFFYLTNHVSQMLFYQNQNQLMLVTKCKNCPSATISISVFYFSNYTEHDCVFKNYSSFWNQIKSNWFVHKKKI